MKSHFIYIILIYFLVHPACNNSKPYKEQKPPAVSSNESKEILLDYFMDTVIRHIKSTLKNYKAHHFGGGVDAFVLMEGYPNLKAVDFNNITTHHGDYIVRNDTLYFSGNAASNSAVLDRKGFGLLFNNVSQRLSITVNTKKDIHTILNHLRLQ